MKSGSQIGRLVVVAAMLLPTAASLAVAQENSAKRLSSIVSVAVEEYRKAIDSQGKVISEEEYAETSSFLADAREIAQRLKGYQRPTDSGDSRHADRQRSREAIRHRKSS
jgi:hypothetical protein